MSRFHVKVCHALCKYCRQFAVYIADNLQSRWSKIGNVSEPSFVDRSRDPGTETDYCIMNFDYNIPFRTVTTLGGGNKVSQ